MKQVKETMVEKINQQQKDVQQERWTARTTVAAIIEKEGKFLLVEEETSAGIRLNNPAGHLEQSESLVDACVRETLEETGWDFIPQALLGVYMHRFCSGSGDDLTYIRYAFVGELGAHHSERSLDKGIIRAVWKDYNELLACQEMHRTALLMSCVDDYLSGKRHPLELINTNPSIYQTS